MASPFFVPSPSLAPGLAGLQETLEANREREEKKLKEREAEERLARISMEAREAFDSGDTDRIMKFTMENPEFSKAVNLMEMQKYRNETTRRNAYDSGYEYLENPTPEKAAEIVAKRKRLLSAQGVSEEDQQETNMFLEMAQRSPEDAQKAVESWLRVADTKQWIEWQKAKGEEKVELTASQKDYRLAKEEGFTGSFIDFKQAISGEGPKTEMEMMKLRAQIADIESRNADRAAERERTASLEDRKTRSLVSGLDSTLFEVDKALSIAQKSKSATGIPGAATAKVPTSPSYKLRAVIDTIKANIGFDRLQSMRDMSPTGGALGQVSERELGFLQATIAALDPNIGDKELIENLEKVKKHYNNWKKTLLGQNPYQDERPISEMTTEELMELSGIKR